MFLSDQNILINLNRPPHTSLATASRHHRQVMEKDKQFQIQSFAHVCISLIPPLLEHFLDLSLHACTQPIHNTSPPYIDLEYPKKKANMADSSPPLTPSESAALFDILTHHETYREISDFKQPGAIHRYGPPFQDSGKSSDSPVLQTLLSKFILPLPGLRDVSADFWKVRVADIINELSVAELSESFDKGILGIRKTLATAISALIEYPARGCLGGLPKEEKKQESRKYNVKNSEDVLRAWQDCLQAIVYGDLIDELFSKAAETDDLTKHDTLVQGMHEFVVVK